MLKIISGLLGLIILAFGAIGAFFYTIGYNAGKDSKK